MRLSRRQSIYALNVLLVYNFNKMSLNILFFCFLTNFIFLKIYKNTFQEETPSKSTNIINTYGQLPLSPQTQTSLFLNPYLNTLQNQKKKNRENPFILNIFFKEMAEKNQEYPFARENGYSKSDQNSGSLTAEELKCNVMD